MLIAHVGLAQNYTPPHIALDKVDRVRIEPIFLDSRKKDACAVHSDRIRTSIKFILNTAGIPFVDGFPEVKYDQTLTAEQQAKQDREYRIPALWVVGDVMSINAGCIYHLDIKVEEDVNQTTLAYSGKSFSGSVELWSSGFYGIAPPTDLTLSSRREARRPSRSS